MELLVRFAADALLLLILGIGVIVILSHILKVNFWYTSAVIVMAGLTSLLVGKIMSLLYQPSVARPFLELGAQPGAAYIDNPGFPSDHALLATVVVVAVQVLTKNKTISLLLVMLLLLMSFGRVAALVHTPLDIIGGILAGLSGAFWYRKLTK
jgi:membrane-associated phospholipid phosphatase